MVEYPTLSLDLIFGSLAHHIRRDILWRASREELCVSDIAKHYNMTLAAISKHLNVLEKARLIIKRRKGKQHFVQVSPAAFVDAAACLKEYEKLWNNRLDSLEQYLSTFPNTV